MVQLRLFFIFILVIVSSVVSAQVSSVTLSGIIKNKTDKLAIQYVNVVVKSDKDGAFIAGTMTNDEGRFTISKIKPGNYQLNISFTGFEDKKHPLFVGSLSEFLDIPTIELEEHSIALEGVTVTAQAGNISNKLDKKIYSVADNISQTGGSVLQTMQNLPGITVQDGKVQLRGNDKVTVLIDGKQTALTGFGSQSGLDNIPSSAIDKIEIINNPSSKYDANGNAGVINIIMKKSNQNGFNGKVGFSSGLGSLWIRKENLPTIRPQYSATFS
ncbi:carboxypeptidase regulatory-like domain-containing protein [Sphingobacterium multivorum]|uniref:carboxypeptidase regulatory-like domain-containing protein n=1 Tax=Sphingobacterium multivorum TaxID=28454 RepID=UPI003DA20AFB